jgi:hypothetical protein
LLSQTNRLINPLPHWLFSLFATLFVRSGTEKEVPSDQTLHLRADEEGFEFPGSVDPVRRTVVVDLLLA